MFEKTKEYSKQKKAIVIFFSIILLVSCLAAASFFAGALTEKYHKAEFLKNYLETIKSRIFPELPQSPEPENQAYIPQTSQEQAIIKVVKDYSPAVVSIIVSKDLPVIEEYYVSPFENFFNDPFFEIKIPQYRQKGTEKKEIGGGSGFIISEDGLIVTNKHVALDDEADYTVLTVDGRKFPAKVLAKDPNQDLAVLKIEKERITDEKGNPVFKPFSLVKLGDSSKLEIGQTVIAIGNALGEYRNTISVGVVSGLGRTITASGGSFVETLENVIQTDAAINKGNSGGPLLNLKGEVIGINTATVLNAQNIGFAIPINVAKRDIEQIKSLGKIVYPFLGIRYVAINAQVQKEKNLSVDYGVLVIGTGKANEPAVISGSAADKAGIKDKDIILEINGQKITEQKTLSKIIQTYNPGDAVTMKILRNNEEKTIKVILEERNE